MNIKNFNELDYHDKLKVLKFQGNEIQFNLSYYGSLKSITTYSVNNFFVKVIFSYKNNKITDIIHYEDVK